MTQENEWVENLDDIERKTLRMLVEQDINHRSKKL